MRSIKCTAAMLIAPVLSPGASLNKPAEDAFQNYVAALEARLAKQHAETGTCAAILSGADEAQKEAQAELLEGSILVEPINGGSRTVPGGLLHHWRAAAFVPGAGPDGMAELLHHFDRVSNYYEPEVVSSHSLADGEGIAMRFRKQLFITVVLDAEFHGESGIDRRGCGFKFSRSTHIWQVDRPGTAEEHRRPPGSDDGFLWRLNSYWSFMRLREGLLIECEAVSLTRDIPAGVGWLITPILEGLPRASLKFTLAATRKALIANAARSYDDARSN